MKALLIHRQKLLVTELQAFGGGWVFEDTWNQFSFKKKRCETVPQIANHLCWNLWHKKERSCVWRIVSHCRGWGLMLPGVVVHLQESRGFVEPDKGLLVSLGYFQADNKGDWHPPSSLWQE